MKMYSYKVIIDTSLGEMVYHIVANDVPNVLRILRTAVGKKSYEIILIKREQDVIVDNQPL